MARIPAGYLIWGAIVLGSWLLVSSGMPSGKFDYASCDPGPSEDRFTGQMSGGGSCPMDPNEESAYQDYLNSLSAAEEAEELRREREFDQMERADRAYRGYLESLHDRPRRAVPRPPAPQDDARKSAMVVRVVDGDTVRLVVDGKEESVRLIGVNTPESVDPRRPVECLGKEASAKMSALLPVGTAVQVESDPTQDTRDRFDRLLLYVYLPSGQSAGLEMIRRGFANEYTYERPYRDQAAHKEAQQQAEAGRLGLWAPGACATQPTPSRGSNPAPPATAATKPAASVAPAVQRPAPTATPSPSKPHAQPTAPPPKPGTSGGVLPTTKDDCPSSHPIKGNQGSRSTTDWIYHPPNSRSYAATDPEECFVTVADAQAAGYRAPRN